MTRDLMVEVLFGVGSGRTRGSPPGRRDHDGERRPERRHARARRRSGTGCPRPAARGSGGSLADLDAAVDDLARRRIADGLEGRRRPVDAAPRARPGHDARTGPRRGDRPVPRPDGRGRRAGLDVDAALAAPRRPRPGSRREADALGPRPGGARGPPRPAGHRGVVPRGAPAVPDGVGARPHGRRRPPGGRVHHPVRRLRADLAVDPAARPPLVGRARGLPSGAVRGPVRHLRPAAARLPPAGARAEAVHGDASCCRSRSRSCWRRWRGGGASTSARATGSSCSPRSR